MVDQYIYTRMERPGRNVGRGFVNRTDGIVGAVQQGVRALTNFEYGLRDGKGNYLPVWMKAALQGRREKIVFQQAVKEYTEGGTVSLYHGYVLDQTEAIFEHPEQWGGLQFCRGVEDIPEKLERRGAPPLRKEKLSPFGEVLNYFQLTTTNFVRLIRSCFDAKRNEELVLVAVDYNRPEAQRMALQLLIWLFRFLPMAMRRSVDCTTCIAQEGKERCAVGLVPTSSVSVRDGHLVLNRKKGFLTGGSILFADGKVERTSGKPNRAAATGSLFGQWMDALASWVVKQPTQQAERAMTALNQVYRRFDAMIVSLPEEDRCKLNYYDALCWNHLMFDRDEAGKRVPARSDLAYFEDLLVFGRWPEVVQSVGKMLDALESMYVTPASAQLIRLMTKIVRLDGVDENLSRAGEMMCAFLSRDMETAEIGESSAVSAKYLQLMASGGMTKAEALELLEQSFFPDEFETAGEVDCAAIWNRAGTSRLKSEGYRRCIDWVSSYVNVCMNVDELIDSADTVMRELDGFRPEMLSWVLDCLLSAQETRCYYAKLEILPAHLTACCHCISRVRGHVPKDYWEVAESYYTKLFVQLCQEYLSYWEGKHTLIGICDLMAEFRREGWRRNEDSLLKELIVAQCNGICEYDWETLKAQMSKEGSDILQRLWRILDQLEDFWGEDDLEDRLCGQVCRYLLHALPEYVNDEWVVCQVEERQNLKRSGYYLEMLALREFLGDNEQSLEQLQFCIRLYHVPTEPMRDMMKFLFRVFQRGGLRRLELVALQGIYTASSKRLKVSQLEVFHIVCQVWGGNALIELLSHWPSAEPARGLSGRRLKRVEAKRRQGSYSWLKTDESLMKTLERLSLEREFLIEVAARAENFFLRLMEEVNQLAPVGTAARASALRINENLLDILEKESGFAIRVLCGSKKRKLLAE